MRNETEKPIFHKKHMSFVKIWVHAVWGTKKRQPVLHSEIRGTLRQHIIDNSKIKGLFIDSIDGYTDHLHCLMTLNADLSIARQMQLIKGESSFWMNKNKFISGRFEWADEYFAASVSEEKLDYVRNYIGKQAEHHKKITFLEEYTNLLKHFHLESDQG